jgi:hypothetical protein
MVGVVDPFMSQLQFAVLSMFGAYLNMKSGVIYATKGIGGNGVMLFDGTRFTNNQNLNSGWAVTLVMGRAVSRDSDFTGNQANKASDSMHTDDALAESLISGFGGAVFARIVSRGNDTLPMQTSATFLNCTFTINMASQGGAIALVQPSWCECAHHQLHLQGQHCHSAWPWSSGRLLDRRRGT